MSRSAYVANRRRQLKQKCVIYKGGSCLICGYSKCIGALEFHHLDPSLKDFSISKIGSVISWEKVYPELDKCILVCANCHREIHNNLIDLNAYLHSNISSEEGWTYLINHSEFGEEMKRIHVSLFGEKLLLTNVCEMCGGYKWLKSKLCRSCSSRTLSYQRGTKISWPSREYLLELLKTTSYLEAGRILGVSDNAIRKHLKTTK